MAYPIQIVHGLICVFIFHTHTPTDKVLGVSVCVQISKSSFWTVQDGIHVCRLLQGWVWYRGVFGSIELDYLKPHAHSQISYVHADDIEKLYRTGRFELSIVIMA